MANLTRFNSLFNDTFFDDFFRPGAFRRALMGSDNEGTQIAGDKLPALDVEENDQAYVLKLDLPGIKKDDIKVDVANGVLSIKAETRNEDKEEKDGKLIRQERYVGSYVRQLSIGSDVDPAAIKARYEDGVLALELPKREPSQPETMQISVD